MVTPVAEPASLLLKAYQEVERAAHWHLIPTSSSFVWEGGVSADVQWYRGAFPPSPHGWEVLIRAETAYLRGVCQLAMLGSGRDLDEVAAVMQGRWLTCDATSFLRRGNDHSAVGQLAKHVCPDPGEEVHVVESTPTDTGALVRLARSGGLEPSIATVAVRAGLPPLIVGIGSDTEHMAAELRYEPGGLPLPDPESDGVLDLGLALQHLSAGGRRPRGISSRTSGRPVEVLVEPPDLADESGSWTVRSCDVIAVAAHESGGGPAAEGVVAEYLAARAPHLLPVIDFDSASDEFFAYAQEERHARELAEVLRSLQQRGNSA